MTWPRSRIALRASLRRVAVVGEDAEAVVEARRQIVEFGELVLRERLGGEEVQRARIGIFENGVQDGQVVAESFARSGRRDDHEIFSRARQLRRGGLMRIKLVDALGAIGGGKFRPHPGGHRAELRLARGNVFDGGDDFVGAITGGESAQRFLNDIQRRLRPYGQAVAFLPPWILSGAPEHLRRLPQGCRGSPFVRLG